KARHAVFGAELSNAMRGGDTVPVKVLGIVESDKPLSAEYNPDHPLANDEGYIYKPNVNVMEEMANMISASRAYQTNVQVADSSKQMLLRTLQMGQ
ncbi:flagellar basal body rod protein FlgC, partial [Salmonella enterica subsp. enterica serovar Kentucky]|nr:flagellar basal body rod protein FlgC [Salmonella enterica subsp. enterica serovar Kentucky]